jgi:hypothetical protein
MLLPTTGKWYSEFTAVYVDGATSPLDIGLLGSTDFPTPSGVIGASATSYAYRNNGNKLNNSVTTAYGASYVIGDIIAIAFDATAGTLTFYKNNVSQGVAFTGLTAQYFFAVGGYNFGQWAANFGQRPFAYTPPTGFVALNTFNLPTATILKGNTVMDATLYTGNGSTQTITNAAGFRPDFVWVKTRSSGSFGHALFDSVRGAPRRLASNLTEAENTTGSFGQVSSFNSNGFTVATGSSSFGETGLNALTYVGWQWQAGQGSSSSNTAGSITSTVSVNASAGFSVVTFNIGSSVPPATVGHGLGVAPKLIIAKDRTTAGGWPVFHASATNQNQYLVLNGTGAVASATNVWGSSLPTSSVFGVTAGITLGANSNCVAYCWSEIDGFSKFGSYVGNSNADGPFIYCGFRPKFVMFKGSSFDNNWYIIDSTTNTINVAGTGLKPNASDSEIANSTTQNAVDFLSNGFKLRNNAAAVAFNNSSGQTFIYAAFAENPFRNSLAR